MTRLAVKAVLFLGLLCAGVRAAADAPQSLRMVDLSQIDPAGVDHRDCQITRIPSGLRIVTGVSQDFPGITLNAPSNFWDLSSYQRVEVHLTNTSSTDATFCCRVDNPGTDGSSRSLTGSIALKPGESGTLQVPLPRRRSTGAAPKSFLFGMRGYPAEFGSEVIDPRDAEKANIDPATINAMVIFVARPTREGSFEITSISAFGRTPVTLLPDSSLFPLIDTFGQYIDRDWPGKTHSLKELHGFAAGEQADLQKHPGPADWDAYGGWNSGPTLEKTGFFRVQKYQGKWWLVDPDGKLFFSQGMDCVNERGDTAVEEREQWFADFPGDHPDFREFNGYSLAQMSYYAGRRVRTFSFDQANLKRRFGDNWQAASTQLAVKRLRSWGLNTIGNWSDPRVFQARKTPYVVTLSSGRNRMIEGSSGYWGKFVDPFDPAFPAQLARGIRVQGRGNIGDPWCIGFFVGNELSWANSGDDSTSLSLATLASPADQPCKQVFVDDLKKKYQEIEKLNQSWGSSYASWDALLQSRAEPEKRAAGADLAAFYTRIAERYFSAVHDAIKAAAPHQLYLGCRFASNSPRTRAAAVKYCDVVSFNLYTTSVAAFTLLEADVPVLIGEFHFGALDRGMFHPGLVPTANQEARAAAYRNYVTGALKNPSIVGCHWFKYQDEPTIGRIFDGENYQIGFVDVVNNPYPETIQAARKVGESMYAIRLGAPKP
jgi:hypothetical protein